MNYRVFPFISRSCSGLRFQAYFINAGWFGSTLSMSEWLKLLLCLCDARKWRVIWSNKWFQVLNLGSSGRKWMSIFINKRKASTTERAGLKFMALFCVSTVCWWHSIKLYTQFFSLYINNVTRAEDFKATVIINTIAQFCKFHLSSMPVSFLNSFPKKRPMLKNN